MMIVQSTFQHKNNLPNNLHVVIDLESKLDWYTIEINRFGQLLLVLLRVEQSNLNCGKVGRISMATLTNLKIKNIQAPWQ